MEIGKREFLTAGVSIGLGLMESVSVAQNDAGNPSVASQSNYKPRRLNKVVELLEQDQPVYYTGAGPLTFDQGKKMAQTYADMLAIEFEHGAPDFTALREFMRGLREGGPTRSGHLTPAVFVAMPVLGLNEAQMYANSWVVRALLDCGVHALDLCHARDPRAIEVYVAAARFPFQRPGVPTLPMEGLRGSGSQGFASQIWGVSPNHYLHIADPWPFNPKGELLLGLKNEDRHALANTEKNLAVPGTTFCEWGPGDMRMSLAAATPGGLDATYPDDPNAFPNGPARAFGRRGGGGGGGGGDEGGGGGRNQPPLPPDEEKAKNRVLAAIKANHKFGLWNAQLDNVIDRIKEGWRVIPGNEATAQKGRAFTNRTMPV